jgi:hypothetical protein
MFRCFQAVYTAKLRTLPPPLPREASEAIPENDSGDNRERYARDYLANVVQTLNRIEKDPRVLLHV